LYERAHLAAVLWLFRTLLVFSTSYHRHRHLFFLFQSCVCRRFNWGASPLHIENWFHDSNQLQVVSPLNGTPNQSLVAGTCRSRSNRCVKISTLSMRTFVPGTFAPICNETPFIWMYDQKIRGGARPACRENRQRSLLELDGTSLVRLGRHLPVQVERHSHPAPVVD